MASAAAATADDDGVAKAGKSYGEDGLLKTNVGDSSTLFGMVFGKAFGGIGDDGNGGQRDSRPLFAELNPLPFLRADDGGARDGRPRFEALDPLSFLRVDDDSDDVRGADRQLDVAASWEYDNVRASRDRKCGAADVYEFLDGERNDGEAELLECAAASVKTKYPHMSLSLSPPFNRRRNLPPYRKHASLWVFVFDVSTQRLYNVHFTRVLLLFVYNATVLKLTRRFSPRVFGRQTRAVWNNDVFRPLHGRHRMIYS